MLDDFEDNDGTFSFLDDLEELPEDDLFDDSTLDSPKGKFLGLTPAQRFVIAMQVFILACILSALCLLVFNKIELPF
ncbi:MAG: hypothetical protein OEV06_01235 [Anaerolineae bacterium]|nr:hypothetical protein [Anaerolineae bacterium]